MSMIGNLRAAFDQELEALLAKPETVEGFLYGPDPDDPTPFQDALFADGLLISLDKAWHGLHFLLTGSAWEGLPPLNFLVAGEPIGEEDVGYEPPRLQSSMAVAEVAESLTPMGVDEVATRFDPARMMKLGI